MRPSLCARLAAACCLLALVLPVTASASHVPLQAANDLRQVQHDFHHATRVREQQRLGIAFIAGALLNPSTTEEMGTRFVQILWTVHYPGVSMQAAHAHHRPEAAAFRALLAHRFETRLYADVYGHLQRTGHFEALMTEMVALADHPPHPTLRPRRPAGVGLMA